MTDICAHTLTDFCSGVALKKYSLLLIYIVGTAYVDYTRTQKDSLVALPPQSVIQSD